MWYSQISTLRAFKKAFRRSSQRPRGKRRLPRRRERLRLEELEDRVVPAYLELVSGPSLVTSGWAVGDIATEHNPQTMTLDWSIWASASAPLDAAPGDMGRGNFSAHGDIVVRVVAEPGDTLGTPCGVFVYWEQDYFWDLDPIDYPNQDAYGNNMPGRNGFAITGELVGVGELPESPGGRGPFNQQGGHTPRYNGDMLWWTAGTGGYTHFGAGGFRAGIGETFTLRFHGSGFSEGIWVGGTDAHGEAGFSTYFTFQLSTENPDLYPESTNARPALTWNEQGGLDLYYRSTVVPLGGSARVAFYWGRTGDDGPIRLGEPFAIAPLNTAVFNPAPIRVSAAALQAPPAEADVIIAVLDDENRIDESNERNNEAIAWLDTDLVARDFFYEADGDAIFTYVVQGRPQSGGVTEFYWATGPNNSDIIDPDHPVLTRSLPTQSGQYQITIAALLVDGRPAAATHLHAYLDATDQWTETSEYNNIATLEGADLVAVTLNYNQEHLVGKRGVDLDYTIKNVNPAEAIEVAYYWATGTTLDDVLAPTTRRILPAYEPTFGSFTGSENEPAKWGRAPDAATYIVAVLDPDNKIKEIDETNNVAALALHSRDEIVNAGGFGIQPSVLDDRTKIEIGFYPGGGAITLSEAQVRFGVDHFNWYQEIVEAPGHWALLHAPPGTTIDLNDDIELPWRDPPIIGANVNEYTIYSEVAQRDARFDNEIIDSAPFYLNEPGEVRLFTDRNRLIMNDLPRFPSDFIRPGEDSVKFQTKLVGVGYDGNMVFLPNVKPIEWKVDATFDEGQYHQQIILLKVLAGTPDLPPVISGGVFDVHTSDAPWFIGIDDDSGLAGDRFTFDNTLVLRGGAEAGSIVTLSREGAGVIGQAVTDAEGFWSLDYSATVLPDGVHVFTAIDDSSRSSERFAVTVDTAAPANLILVAGPVAEAQPAGTVVGRLDTEDHRGRLFTYSLAAGEGDADNAAFRIEGNTLVTTGALDFEMNSNYHVRVRADGANGQAAAQSFIVQISDVYEGPTNLTLSAATVGERSPTGTVVGTLNADGTGALRYQLAHGDGDEANGHFAIIGAQLVISVPLPYADGATRTIRVQAIDASGLTTERSFGLTIIASSGENEPPAFTMPATVSIPANTTVIRTVTASDPDGDLITFRITGGEDAADCSLTTGGMLSFNVAPDVDNPSDIDLNNIYEVQITASDGNGGSVTQLFQVIVGPMVLLATGADAGTAPQVRVRLHAILDEVFTFLAYDAGFTGGVRVATADLNGDRIPEVITVPGSGAVTGNRLHIYNGADLLSGTVNRLAQLDPFAGDTSAFHVAAGEIDGDGVPDLVVSNTSGAGPYVKVLSGSEAVQGNLAELAPAFQPFGPRYKGGIRLAVGDVNGDGHGDVVAGKAKNGALVKVFSGANLATVLTKVNVSPTVILKGGVFVAAGDFNGDLRADLAIGYGSDKSLVRVYQDVSDSSTKAGLLSKSGPIYGSAFKKGVRVAAADWDGDGQVEIITAAGPGSERRVLTLAGTPLVVLDAFFAEEWPFAAGLYLAAAPLG